MEGENALEVTVASKDNLSSSVYSIDVERSASTEVWAERLPSSTYSSNDDRFGSSISIDGVLIAVGARAGGPVVDGRSDVPSPAGAVYLYEKHAGSWVEQAVILAPYPIATDNFGIEVALSGSTLAVACLACVDNDGEPVGPSVYVFTKENGTWEQTAHLRKTDSRLFSFEYGVELALSEDVLVVGSARQFVLHPDWPSTNDNGISVFERSGTRWDLTASLAPEDPTYVGLFGIEVALDDDEIYIGAEGGSAIDQRSPAAVHIFKKENGVWQQDAYIPSPTASDASRFGAAIASKNNLLVIGAPNVRGLAGSDTSTRGNVFIYERTGREWALQSTLYPPAPEAIRFGWDVAAREGIIAIYSGGRDTYIYTLENSDWINKKTLEPIYYGRCGTRGVIDMSDQYVIQSTVPDSSYYCSNIAGNVGGVTVFN